MAVDLFTISKILSIVPLTLPWYMGRYNTQQAGESPTYLFHEQ